MSIYFIQFFCNFEQVNVTWETNALRIKLPPSKQNKDTYDALISIRLWIIGF